MLTDFKQRLIHWNSGFRTGREATGIHAVLLGKDRAKKTAGAFVIGNLASQVERCYHD